MQPRTLITLPIVLVAILATAPAFAQVYKWVDERGVTNYSNQPPADPKTARKLALVEDGLSVYTPDKAFMQAVDAFRQRSARVSAERVAGLERELEAERQARQYAAAAEVRAAYDYSSYYPYGPAVVFVPFRHRPRRIVQPQLTPGTIAGHVTGMNGVIAGNVVGMNGFIPGNSARAPARTVLPSRSLLEAPRSRGFARR
ncbi:MAG: hypothetical protein A3G24_13820 [Betaproteobacteria bacterium RIFCSPLOWO2_12_FULL_62_13]|nr:MAG: hypothetical protein A3G24_13820 [Betaproteobacteria bacterium RIFCSPLOWO2_12_FULL_62_13]